MIKKIALINKPESAISDHHIAQLRQNFANHNIHSFVFENSHKIMQSNLHPDCVIILNPHAAKLTPYPTYVLLTHDTEFSVSRRRLVRNLLTYDGYLTSSEFDIEILEDLLFSARKLGSSIMEFSILPSGSYYKTPKFETASAAIFPVSEQLHSKLVNELEKDGVISSYAHQNLKGDINRNTEQLVSDIYNQHGIGIDLFSCDDLNRKISFNLLEIISSGAIAITNHSDYVYEIFGDNILYLDPKDKKEKAASSIKKHIDWIHNNPKLAAAKSKNAYQIFKKLFATTTLIKNLNKFHQKTLYNKHYLPPKNEQINSLASISYIVRAGGNPPLLRRALDSLVAQNYAKIQIIFVLYKKLENIEKIITDYKDKLSFKIIEDFGGLRSTAIAAGIAAVDTDYFGLMDDDDMLHPNHIRSLIKTLEYHNALNDWRGKIKLAYSGSYLASEEMDFAEKPEWHDDLLECGHRKHMVENFAFYDPYLMSQNRFYMMSNSWLACKTLINEELLRDPKTHSHEDIYFELQFALHTHFAFSVEMTSVHWFHGNNSTIIDQHRNNYDVCRNMLGLHLRNFPSGNNYRTDHYPEKIQAISNIINFPYKQTPEYLLTKFTKQRRNAKSYIKKIIKFFIIKIINLAERIIGKIRIKIHY